MRKLVPINDTKNLSNYSIYATYKTLSKWFREKKYPNLLVKVLGRIYFDVTAWERYLDEMNAGPIID